MMTSLSPLENQKGILLTEEAGFLQVVNKILSV